MNSLLPVLASNPPQMQLCNICPAPGSCCNNFVLPTYNDQRQESIASPSWREDAEEWLDREELPFSVRRRELGEIASIRFGCDQVTASGRCSIYEDRPDTCRTFVPGSDELCVFHAHHQLHLQNLSEWQAFIEATEGGNSETNHA